MDATVNGEGEEEEGKQKTKFEIEIEIVPEIKTVSSIFRVSLMKSERKTNQKPFNIEHKEEKRDKKKE